MYIDVIVEHDDDGVARPEVEAEYEAAVRDMERAREESARLHSSKLRDDFVPVPTGWDVLCTTTYLHWCKSQETWLEDA